MTYSEGFLYHYTSKGTLILVPKNVIYLYLQYYFALHAMLRPFKSKLSLFLSKKTLFTLYQYAQKTFEYITVSMYFRVSLIIEKPTLCCCFTWIAFIELDFRAAFMLISKTWMVNLVVKGMEYFKKWVGS